MATLPRFSSVWAGRNFAAWVRETRGRSGAYVIRDATSREILYVGESHRKKLYETLTRHFQQWDGPTSGPTYDRDRVEVAAIESDNAVELQNELIVQLNPRDNVRGQPPADDGEEVPF